MSKKKTPNPGKMSPHHSNEEIAKVLSGQEYVTSVQLAARFGLTKTTAQVYLKRLAKTRKIETKLVRQGLRGPKAIGFRIRVTP